jgi:hypothetical protein
MGVGEIVSFLPIDKKSSAGRNLGDSGRAAASRRLTGAFGFDRGGQELSPVGAIAILAGGRIESSVSPPVAVRTIE